MRHFVIWNLLAVLIYSISYLFCEKPSDEETCLDYRESQQEESEMERSGWEYPSEPAAVRDRVLLCGCHGVWRLKTCMEERGLVWRHYYRPYVSAEGFRTLSHHTCFSLSLEVYCIKKNKKKNTPIFAKTKIKDLFRCTVVYIWCGFKLLLFPLHLWGTLRNILRFVCNFVNNAN